MPCGWSCGRKSELLKVALSVCVLSLCIRVQCALTLLKYSGAIETIGLFTFNEKVLLRAVLDFCMLGEDRTCFVSI